MAIQHVRQPEITEAELEREYELYSELLDNWPNDWFVITKGELIHAAEPEEMVKLLRARGIGSGDLFVSKAPGPPPYRVR